MIWSLMEGFYLICLMLASIIWLLTVSDVPSFRKSLMIRWLVCSCFFLHSHILRFVTGMTQGDLERMIGEKEFLASFFTIVGAGVYTLWIAVDYRNKQKKLIAKQQKVNASNTVLQYGDPIITDDEIESKDK